MIPPRLVRFQDRLQRIAERIGQSHPEVRLEAWSFPVGIKTRLNGWTLGIEVHGLSCPLELEIAMHTLCKKPELWRAEVTWYPEEGWGEREASLFDIGKEPGFRDVWNGLSGLEKALEEAIERSVPNPREPFEPFDPRKYVPTERDARVGDPDLEIYRAIAEQWLAPDGVDAFLFGRTTVTDSWGPEMVKMDPAAVAQLYGRYLPEGVPGEAWRDLQVRGLEELRLDLLRDRFQVEDIPLGWRFLRNQYRRHPNAHGRIEVSRVGFHGDHAVVKVNNEAGTYGNCKFDDTLLHFVRRDGDWLFQKAYWPLPLRGEERVLGGTLDLELWLLRYFPTTPIRLVHLDTYSHDWDDHFKMPGAMRFEGQFPDGRELVFTLMSSGYLFHLREQGVPVFAAGHPVLMCRQFWPRDVIPLVQELLSHEPV